MDTSRLRFGEMIAAVSGAVLLLVMFLSWYKYDLKLGNGVADQFAKSALSSVDTTATAWQAFGFVDIVMFLAALVAIGLAVLTMTQRSVALPVAASVIVTAIGGFALLLVIIRFIDPPGGNLPDQVEIKRQFGLFLGLLATAGIAGGGFLSMREEGTSFGDAAAAVQGGGASRPPATPAPPASAPPASAPSTSSPPPPTPPAAPPAGGAPGGGGGAAPPPASPPPGGGEPPAGA